MLVSKQKRLDYHFVCFIAGNKVTSAGQKCHIKHNQQSCISPSFSSVLLNTLMALQKNKHDPGIFVFCLIIKLQFFLRNGFERGLTLRSLRSCAQLRHYGL